VTSRHWELISGCSQRYCRKSDAL